MTGAQEARDTVEMFWPYDGLHTDETVEGASVAVERLVRYMANATYRPVRSAPALYRVLSNLDAAMHNLDQVLRQLGEITAPKLEQDGSLYDDRRDRPGSRTVRQLAERLDATRGDLSSGATGLSLAARLASHLGHDVPAAVDNSEAVDW